ncbi:unnamed protein product [Urochloa decumbens]|uniref:KIB1-4 beta-propeller domain-containing protein n=1 Tax=Urochloa decumbens TaxID=240449 RepID=A0ABC8ZBI4_9POAL
MESKPSEEPCSPLAAASFPLLVYDYGYPPDFHQAMLSAAGMSMRALQVHELCNYTCLETPHGLVLMADTVTSSGWCCLWNPQTGEKIPLPAMEKMLPERCRCLLSGAVSSPDCLVLVHTFGEPELMFCRVRGGGAWVTQSYDIGLCQIPGSQTPPKKKYITGMAAVQGKFYFFEAPDVLQVFSFVQSPEPHLELATCFDAITPRFTCDDAPRTATVTLSYLLESCQELFLVCLFYLGCDFEHLAEVTAYRMDFSKQEWCKVTDIGDKAFFLGSANFAASCSATEHGLRKGCVYFANDFLGDSNDFYIFDLKEGTRELVGPNQDIPVLTHKPFWMVPVVL